MVTEQPVIYREIDRLKAELATVKSDYRIASEAWEERRLEQDAELAAAQQELMLFRDTFNHNEIYAFELQTKLGDAEAERDKLAAASEWYADPVNYLNSVPGHWGEWQDAEPDGHRRKWVQDHGQRARQALGRE